ncbi:hypothetical protein COLO4_13049 [Corchorus olitorius]|uniref:Uncharacterized protein n=1 Tax=Corchorus olitorius TaxID=93759 RepID=A0A1R3JYI9_9ROSI|nr:hypothetical protein COLO4_13049 [Corchorus olitorius]
MAASSLSSNVVDIIVEGDISAGVKRMEIDDTNRNSKRRKISLLRHTKEFDD